MKIQPFRECVRLLYHLNDVTKVVIERLEGLAFADGTFMFDVPTQAIPVHLRRIGSRFMVVGQHVRPDPHDSAEDIRKAMVIRVEEVDGPCLK